MDESGRENTLFYFNLMLQLRKSVILTNVPLGLDHFVVVSEKYVCYEQVRVINNFVFVFEGDKKILMQSGKKLLYLIT